PSKVPFCPQEGIGAKPDPLPFDPRPCRESSPRRKTSRRRDRCKGESPMADSRQVFRSAAERIPANGGFSGGGGNRTRVRGRTGQSVYKLRLPLNFARRPVGSRPTAGLAILWCRASGDWLSLGAEPVFDAATRTTGRVRSDALSY